MGKKREATDEEAWRLMVGEIRPPDLWKVGAHSPSLDRCLSVLAHRVRELERG